ncbi:hypothetical protein MIND_01239000 [Mycena indigotica]|uniref:Uncharacterized protein n=1 Tax=Mycena indigotica TaxID=2126181 RepID=A0A8H6S6C5_9AGAR|nr:uncharacterized protein MIND_01239000 [Mycena indigotica]KAF7292120.1 hypothetical protein MIND_01239000 [Mycena indigotica]
MMVPAWSPRRAQGLRIQERVGVACVAGMLVMWGSRCEIQGHDYGPSSRRMFRPEGSELKWRAARSGCAKEARIAGHDAARWRMWPGLMFAAWKQRAGGVGALQWTGVRSNEAGNVDGVGVAHQRMRCWRGAEARTGTGSQGWARGQPSDRRAVFKAGKVVWLPNGGARIAGTLEAVVRDGVL